MRRALLATTLLFAAGAAHAQTMGSGTINGMNYLTMSPPGGCTAAAPCQIVTYLHYFGGENQMSSDLPTFFGAKFWAANPHAIVLAPMIPSATTNNWGGVQPGMSPNMANVIALVKQTEATIPTQTDNVVLTGGSMGGLGTEAGMIQAGPKGTIDPGVFAIGLSYAGADYTAADQAAAKSALCGVNITLVHGTADPSVPYAPDAALAQQLNGCPGFQFISMQGALHGVWGSGPEGYQNGPLLNQAMAAARAIAPSASTPTASALPQAAPVAPAVPQAAPTPSATNTPPDQDIVTLKPGGGTVTVDGHEWEIGADSVVYEDGRAVYASRGTSDMAFVQNADGTWTVWGKDDGNGPIPGAWFTISSTDPNARWVVSQTPPGPAASPAPPATAVDIPPTPVQSCATPTVAAGGFHVNGGQIIGPNGVFVARGINIYGNQDAMKAGGLATQTFKGLNFVRYIVRDPLNDPSTYAAFANLMTPQGIVVEFEHHPDGGGGQDAPFTGSKLAAESAWYASMAKAFGGNPYVWFGTFNEPGVGSAGQLSAWHKATYDAIRSTGSKALLMIEPGGSRPWNLVDALVPSVYGSMTNIVMDPHVYPYQNNYSSDATSITDNINGMIAAAQKIKSADGTIPVIIGESGPSTTGSNLDPNGYATVQGLINVAQTGKMGGLAQFTWYPGFQSPNNMTDSAGNPTTPYGQMAQLYIGTDVVPPSACQATATAQNSLNDLTAQVTGQPEEAPPTEPAATPPATPTSGPASDPAVQTQIDAADAAIAQANAIIARLKSGQ